MSESKQKELYFCFIIPYLLKKAPIGCDTSFYPRHELVVHTLQKIFRDSCHEFPNHLLDIFSALRLSQMNFFLLVAPQGSWKGLLLLQN